MTGVQTCALPICCPRCSLYKNTKYTLQEFVEDANKVHNYKYNYSKSIYKNRRIKLIIICPIHGEFSQSPVNHIYNKTGCPFCKTSKGENTITKFLKKNNIEFKPQHRFKNCKYKRALPFDFYLPEHNLCIEYDGEQHFNSRWLGIKNLKIVQRNDMIKNKYCKNNNIKLTRISFRENIIEKLEKYLNV